MTTQEAIKELEVAYLGDTFDLMTAKHEAIKALEKQIPKKPIEKEFYNIPHCICPICEGGLYHEQQYCDECGQALKWGEEDV